MTDITTTAVATAMVVILTTILLVMVFSRSRSRDSNGGDGGVVVPVSNTSASSSSSSSGCWKYDVFLSFRGEDTRKTFVDHLYYALQQKGICTYKDDVTLDRGDTIGPALLKAIQESQIALIVFSEKYADSSWCLDELSYIMKCKEERGQIVMPVFYNVDPSDVRKQKGKFGKAFAKHNNNKKNKVESWKKTLVDASNIAGWETKHVANGHEAKCIQEIVGSILDKVPSLLDSAVSDENLVGMKTRLEDLKQLLRIGSGGVWMVGIWGVGGGGKTTLATSLFMEISGNFGGCCLLENIREKSRQENGLRSLQEKILSTICQRQIQVQSVDIGKQMIKSNLCRRNVFIVLDDVDHLDQLKALAGCHKWFGDGSRIIITTRDQHLLTTHRVDEVSPINLLSHDEAIRLFNKHAFNEDNPLQDYEMLSQKIVSYAAGLPLALIVLGSFLYDKDNDEWLSTLSRLKDHPEMDIVEKLRISYDGLKRVEQELFLDIACFFRGKMKDDAMEILDACGFYPAIGIKVLKQKALISVSKDGRFDMHDLVEEMAHYIVRGEHPNNPEKHSRVWRYQDIEDICSRNATAENDKIEAIICNVRVCPNFIMLVSNMKKLRVLSFLHVITSLDTSLYTSLDEGPSFLSNELRHIFWSGYPASPFPESFQPRKLAVLYMHRSLQKELWKGYKYLPSLKELKLSWMRALVRIPDFGGLPCLQKLILDYCGSLEEIHQSLGNHSSLVYVSVSDCNKLTRFPSIVGMEKLEILRISSCEALVEFPKIEARMDNLVELSLERVGIEVLPSSVGEYCTNLTLLKLEDCSNLKSIEGNFHALKCLKKCELSKCSQFEKLPTDLFNENLDELRLSLSLNSSNKQLILCHLPRFLRKLNLRGCRLKDGEMPNEIGELSNLQELDLSCNDFTRLDFSLSQLIRLKLLDLSFCRNLVELPELPSSLAILEANYCESLEAVIRDEIHTNCKWLCKVSIFGLGKKKNIIGGERLLETMFQGNAGVESGCMSLKVLGSEIPRGFEPRVVRGERCRMQLPSNWFHHFSGFLFCAVSDDDSYLDGTITMKHVEKLEEEHDDDDVYWEERDDDENNFTWVGYISFGLLRHTLWWDDTSTSIQIEFYSNILSTIIGCGFKLVQMETSSSEISLDDHFNCKFDIQHDSKSDFRCRFKW